ncbi:MAG: hypothetical protein FWF96_00005, partial [Kiritimatiellaeota bacterium]|nr:hypothetical protein [Kiritimatiellota bacterium]
DVSAVLVDGEWQVEFTRDKPQAAPRPVLFKTDYKDLLDLQSLYRVWAYANPVWFMVLFPKGGEPRVRVLHPPGKFPYLHFYHKEYGVQGISFLEGGLDKNWFMSHAGGAVVFSNEVISVTVREK